MKYLIIIPFLYCIIGVINAQENNMTIELSDLKTTIIYLPENVKDVDVGYPEDFDHTYENDIVKITALASFDYTTNLSIITTNGIYGFDIKYNENPKKKYYSITPEQKVITFKKENKDKTDIKEVKETRKENLKSNVANINNHTVAKILNNESHDFIKYKDEQKMFFILKGAYVKDDIFYFHFSIENKSTIDYDVDYISARCVSTKSKSQRTAYEEYDLNKKLYPIIELVKMDEKTSFVLETPKFTLEKKTKLVFGIHEKDGGRDGIFNFNKIDFSKIKKID